MPSITRAAALALALAVPLAAPAAQSSPTDAPTYPTRPVRIIVPFAAGGPTDLMARLLGTKVAEGWGQPVIVENRPGASANIGIGIAAKAAPDGHTLLMSLHAIVVNPSLYEKLPWHPLRDFIPVTNTATAPNVVIAYPGLPAKSLKELIALVKASPGKFSFGSPGAATSSHLTMERVRLAAGIDVQHVPYGGAAPVVNAVVGNQVPVAFVSQSGVAMQMVQAGKVRALATTGARRSAALPDVPTLRESGFDFTAEAMNGLFVPARTPDAVVDRIHAGFVKALQWPDVRARLAVLGFEPVGNSRADFTRYVKTEIEQWSRVIREAGIKPE
jgi:tripartite-type tricarboxylate transporter receptor subunit TctC